MAVDVAELAKALSDEQVEQDAKAIFDRFDDPAYHTLLLFALGTHVVEMLEEMDAKLKSIIADYAPALSEKIKKAYLKAYIKDYINDQIAIAKGLQVSKGIPGMNVLNGLTINVGRRFDESEHPRDNQGRFREKGDQLHGAAAAMAGAHVENVAGASYQHRFDDDRFAGMRAAGPHLTQALRSENGGDALLHSTQALGHLVGGRKGQAALDIAAFERQFGKDAKRSLLPHIKRYTYRYRGVEAGPGQLDTLGGRQIQRNGKGEITREESVEQYQMRLAKHLANRLPSKQQLELTYRAGETPPSEGYILDKNGKVTHQALGLSDDHYVPFTLKMMSDLKGGGSYVRTRTYGGPTTEDMHIALMTGAKSLVVVSKNGAYRVTFNDRALAGMNRFGEPQKRMIDSYGRILDAIKNGKVPDKTVGEMPEGESEVEHPGLIKPDVELRPYLVGDKRRTESFSYWDEKSKQRITEQRPYDALYDKNTGMIIPGGVYWDPTAGAAKVNEAKVREFYDGLNERAQEKEKGEKKPEYPTLKLNFKGYEVALKTLKNQYPYYIDDVQYIRTRDMGIPITAAAREHDEDRGYVELAALRPWAAATGRAHRRANARENKRALRLGYEQGSPHEDSGDVDAEYQRARREYEQENRPATAYVAPSTSPSYTPSSPFRSAQPPAAPPAPSRMDATERQEAARDAAQTGRVERPTFGTADQDREEEERAWNDFVDATIEANGPDLSAYDHEPLATRRKIMEHLKSNPRFAVDLDRIAEQGEDDAADEAARHAESEGATNSMKKVGARLGMTFDTPKQAFEAVMNDSRFKDVRSRLANKEQVNPEDTAYFQSLSHHAEVLRKHINQQERDKELGLPDLDVSG